MKCQARFDNKPCRRNATQVFTTTMGATKSQVTLVVDHNLCDRCCKVVEQLTDFMSRALAKMQNKNPFVKVRP